VSSNRGLVLIAEDHRLFASLLGRAFEEAGYTTFLETAADQVAEAVLRERPSLAVVDADMRPFDTFHALRAICALDPDVRPAVIVLSGHDDPAVRARALELGAAEFLLKGSDPEELFALVDRVTAARDGR
jgi:DNA-binding response OmpR family regulator